MFRCWVYATKDEALTKWNELNEANADKARQVFADGVLKIDKIFS